MTANTPDPLLGTLLGRYRILARIGEGGMGVVYRARDTGLERDVAIKVLPPELAGDPEARAALLREARTASHLNHPHVCTVHEVGQDGEHVWIAMELVEGRPLRLLIPPGGMSDHTVVRYAAPLARALAHAHERRVLHRDVKTANVMVGPDGHAKLMDFGLSRRILDELPTGADTTPTSGSLAGTPQYLAPEVLMGEPPATVSDIWSLGVVLYNMCSGSLPFGGGAPGSLVTAILKATPQPLPPHTGPGLRAVVTRCLAKDPAQRYVAAAEVAAALEALLPGSLAVPLAPRRRGLPRVVLPLAAMAIVGIVAIAGTLWWRARGPAPGPPATGTATVLILPMEVRGQVRDADFAGRAFSEALAVNLAQVNGVRVMPVPAVSEMWSAGTLGKTRAALLAGADRLVLGALAREGDSLRVSVNLVDTRANRVLWGLQHAGSASDLSFLAAAIAQPLAAQLGAREPKRYDYFLYVTGPPAMARSLEMTEALGAVRRWELPQSLASTQRLVARFPGAADAHVLRLAALLIAAVSMGTDPASRTAIAAELATLQRLDPGNPWCDAVRGMLAPPGPAALRILGALAARTDLTPAARGAVLAMRADKYAGVADTASAIADGEQAVLLDPASDLSLSTLARALSHAGRYAEAAQRVRQALALNPTVVNYWLQLGNCMLKQGQWKEYVADLGHAVALSPRADAILSAQSDGLACVGRRHEAEACARKAMVLAPQRMEYALQLALALMRLGKWPDALPLLERACTSGSQPACAIHQAARAVVQSGAGDAGAALEAARRAAAAPACKSGDYALACYHTLRGDHAAALQLLERFPERGWVEPAIGEDPNLAALRTDPRFGRLTAWMRAQPVDQVFADWGRSR